MFSLVETSHIINNLYKNTFLIEFISLDDSKYRLHKKISFFNNIGILVLEFIVKLQSLSKEFMRTFIDIHKGFSD